MCTNRITRFLSSVTRLSEPCKELRRTEMGAQTTRVAAKASSLTVLLAACLILGAQVSSWASYSITLDDFRTYYTGPTGTIYVDRNNPVYSGSIHWVGCLAYTVTLENQETPVTVSEEVYCNGIDSDGGAGNSLGPLSGTQTVSYTFDRGYDESFSVGPGTYDTYWNQVARVDSYYVYGTADRSFTVTPIPEPSGLLALGSGLAGLGGVFFRRRPPSPRLRRTGRR